MRRLHARDFGDPERVPGLVDALRAAPGTLEPNWLVATRREEVVGHVKLSACRLDDRPRPVDVLGLSPLGVRPDLQRRGVGTRLVEAALRTADERGIPLVLVVRARTGAGTGAAPAPAPR